MGCVCLSTDAYDSVLRTVGVERGRRRGMDLGHYWGRLTGLRHFGSTVVWLDYKSGVDAKALGGEGVVPEE